MARSWNHLPDLILLEIFSYLDFRDRYSASLVCRNWLRLFETPSLWQVLISVFHGVPSKAKKAHFANLILSQKIRTPSCILSDRKAVQFTDHHGHHLRHLGLMCDPIYKSKCKNLQRKISLFLKRLADNQCCLKGLYFLCGVDSKKWHVDVRHDLDNSFIQFIESQNQLEKFAFHSVPKDRDLRILDALVKNNGKTLKHVIFISFVFRHPKKSIEDIYYQALCQMPNLEYIKLCLEALDDLAVQNLSENCPNLKTIEILAKTTIHSAPGVSAYAWHQACTLRPHLEVKFRGVPPLRYSDVQRIMTKSMPLVAIHVIVRQNNIPECEWSLMRYLDYIRETFAMRLEKFSYANNHTYHNIGEIVRSMVLTCPKLQEVIVNTNLNVSIIEEICQLIMDLNIDLKIFQVRSKQYKDEDAIILNEITRRYEDMARKRNLCFMFSKLPDDARNISVV